MTLNSIKLKISVFYTVILAAILLFYSAINYYNLRNFLYRGLDNDILVKAQEVSSAINSYLDVLGSDQRAFDFAAKRVIRLEGSHPNQEKAAEVERLWLEKRDKQSLADAYIDLVSIDRGEAVVYSPNMDQETVKNFLKDTFAFKKKTLSYNDLDFGNHQFRVVNIPFYYNFKKKQVFMIQVGVSRKPIFTMLSERKIFAAVTIPLILLIASLSGWLITDRTLKPIMKVTRVARNITHKDLSIRVISDRKEEEVKYLVNAFNEMISRLDNSFRYIAEFSSNVAHELKTPLTIIRGESELALMQERDNREYQRVIKVNLDETEGMLKIVDDLLLLSRLEYQPGAFNFEQVDFGAFIEEVFEQAKKMAAPKNINVKLVNLAKPVTISADALHLRRMFLNLLNNAVKFTRLRGDIAIKVQVEGKKLEVSVSDTGVGIRDEDIGKIFDRFFHVDHPDRGSESGTGLGLSIAQSIAKIHRGDISVKSELQKGSTFIVSLPL